MNLNDVVRLHRLGKPAMLYPGLAHAFGFKEGVFLTYLLVNLSAKPGAWLCKSVKTIERETALTYKEQRRIRKSLVRQRVLEEKHDRKAHKVYFRIRETP